MSHPVILQEVSRFGDDFAKLQLFAKSFEHYVNPFASARMFELRRKEQTFGYCDVVYLPVVFPAFHPGIASPRDVVETLQAFKHVHQVSHGGEGLLGVPIADERKTFPEELLGKMGFTRMKREVYSSTSGV
ncbi:MAG: hypothetical protein WC069_06450 [Candidatus Shapirobacteria bacterium]|nr:hypothetical protein [Terrimicrobiaceae bacterium]